MWGFGEWGCWDLWGVVPAFDGTAMVVVGHPGDPTNCVAHFGTSFGIVSARVAF